jgi:glycerol-3-phosphate dehydrogenase
MSRQERLAHLTDETFDVLVLGGGVIGASTAWAAARTGARVALVDRGDAAGATSSTSSKLVHGGLRYLALGDIGLVREAHRERRWNARVVAPHLVHPLRFILPVGAGAPYGPTAMRAGVFFYSALSGFRDGHAGRIRPNDALALAPGLARRQDTTYIAYYDHKTDDARLVLAVLGTAEHLGATWINYVEAESLRIVAGAVVGADVRDLVTGARLAINARTVVNATGPWVDRVRELESPNAGTTVQLSKGAHLVLETDLAWQAAVTSPLAEGRVSFAIPWHEMLLLGTTDEPFDGDPASVTATEADRAQILSEAAGALDPDVLRPDRVRASFAGLRVLPQGGSTTAGTRRETVITVGKAGMISVAGGKLTTWRKIGIDVASLALSTIGRPGPDPGPVPLFGAADPERVTAELGLLHPQLSDASRGHLARLYGSLAHDVLAPALEAPELYELIVAGAPDLLAQARYAVEAEHALTAEDVLRRRTTISVRGLDAAARDRIAPYLSGASTRG